MELELKHIAPYLPYNLKYNDWDGNAQIISGVPDLAHVEYYCDKTDYGRQDHISEVKPLLRPMSDLFKEIEHNGETVCVAAKIVDEFQEWLEFYEFDGKTLKDSYTKELYNFSQPLVVNQLPYCIVKMLFKYHFDVFGLIEKGLAEPIENK